VVEAFLSLLGEPERRTNVLARSQEADRLTEQLNQCLVKARGEPIRLVLDDVEALEQKFVLFWGGAGERAELHKAIGTFQASLLGDWGELRAAPRDTFREALWGAELQKLKTLEELKKLRSVPGEALEVDPHKQRVLDELSILKEEKGAKRALEDLEAATVGQALGFLRLASGMWEWKLDDEAFPTWNMAGLWREAFRYLKGALSQKRRLWVSEARRTIETALSRALLAPERKKEVLIECLRKESMFSGVPRAWYRTVDAAQLVDSWAKASRCPTGLTTLRLPLEILRAENKTLVTGRFCLRINAISATVWRSKNWRELGPTGRGRSFKRNPVRLIGRRAKRISAQNPPVTIDNVYGREYQGFPNKEGWWRPEPGPVVAKEAPSEEDPAGWGVSLAGAEEVMTFGWNVAIFSLSDMQALSKPGNSDKSKLLNFKEGVLLVPAARAAVASPAKAVEATAA
jgi:hypothetical protein